jgi:hypothetical protein
VLGFKTFAQAPGNLGFIFNDQEAHIPPSSLRTAARSGTGA